MCEEEHVQIGNWASGLQPAYGPPQPSTAHLFLPAFPPVEALPFTTALLSTHKPTTQYQYNHWSPAPAQGVQTKRQV